MPDVGKLDRVQVAADLLKGLDETVSLLAGEIDDGSASAIFNTNPCHPASATTRLLPPPRTNSGSRRSAA